MGFGTAQRHSALGTRDDALMTLERNDRAVWPRLEAAHVKSDVPISHAGRGRTGLAGPGSRQTLLAAALKAVDVRPVDEALGRAAGELLRRTAHPRAT